MTADTQDLKALLLKTLAAPPDGLDHWEWSDLFGVSSDEGFGAPDVTAVLMDLIADGLVERYYTNRYFSTVVPSYRLAGERPATAVYVRAELSDSLPGCWCYMLLDPDDNDRMHAFGHVDPVARMALRTREDAESAGAAKAAEMGLKVLA